MAADLGFQRLLVPVAENAETEQAVDVACRLATQRAAVVTLVAVVEIPPLLPLDAHMVEEEACSQRLLKRHAAIVDSYGVGLSRRLLRGREAAAPILAQAEASDCEVILLGVPHRRPTKRGLPAFGSTVEHVLKRAPCRVMLIGPAPHAVASVHAAA
jgi:nucleotide-binding universal stress UspA family protein